MRTHISIDIDAPPELVFALARDVERWPRLLPHYVSATVLDRRPDYLVFTRVNPEGVPFLVAWDRWRERVESEYELWALVRTGGPPGPAVLTGEPFTPERWKQGYQMTVYRLRPAAAAAG